MREVNEMAEKETVTKYLLKSSFFFILFRIGNKRGMLSTEKQVSPTNLIILLKLNQILSSYSSVRTGLKNSYVRVVDAFVVCQILEEENEQGNDNHDTQGQESSYIYPLELSEILDENQGKRDKEHTECKSSPVVMAHRAEPTEAFFAHEVGYKLNCK
jgi:hypothetical protein